MEGHDSLSRNAYALTSVSSSKSSSIAACFGGIFAVVAGRDLPGLLNGKKDVLQRGLSCVLSVDGWPRHSHGGHV